MKSQRHFALWCAALTTAGCSGGPSRVTPPHIDPQSAAERACEMYDANHDGALDAQELAACPAVLDKLKAYDQNGDGMVQRDELASRLEDLLQYKVALTQLKCQVSYRGQPLSGAEVVLEPEPYLGDEIKAAAGTTDVHGLAQMSIPTEEIPEDLRRVRVVHYGTFKVRITHPQVELPAKYNKQTQLGYETELGNPFANFSLTKGK